MKTLYEAGKDKSQDYMMCLDLSLNDTNETISDLKTRFIEFWCQSHCQGGWRVERTKRSLLVSFSLISDAVLFKFSSESHNFRKTTADIYEFSLT